jgi:hypothetical protein
LPTSKKIKLPIPPKPPDTGPIIRKLTPEADPSKCPTIKPDQDKINNKTNRPTPPPFKKWNADPRKVATRKLYIKAGAVIILLSV